MMTTMNFLTAVFSSMFNEFSAYAFMNMESSFRIEET